MADAQYVWTTPGGIVEAFRRREGRAVTGSPSQNERLGVSIEVIESTRLFALEDGWGHELSLEAARRMKDYLFSMSDAEWWDYGFTLYPTLLLFLRQWME